MGFTLRATLDLLPPDATVVVAELVPPSSRGTAAARPLAGHPLKDRRVVVEEGDVALTLRSSPSRFDAVLLDVDNGHRRSPHRTTPGSTTIAAAHARKALKAGVLAVWSARADRRFEQRLRYGGFTVEVERVRGRLKKAVHATLFSWAQHG